MKKKKWDIGKNIVYIKVGSFFIIALFLLFIALLSIREFTFFKGTYVIKVKFDFAEGLRPSSPVRFCGVDVGEVKAVTVKEDYRPYVIVFVKVQKGVHIPKGSYFFINSLSLLGEKYLEISPPEKIDSYLKNNELVEGISPIPLFNLFATFNKTMKEISDFVKEGKIKTSFENTLVNLEQASYQIRSLMESIQNKQGTIGKLFYDDSLYRKTEEMLDDLKKHPWKLLHKPKEKKRR